MTAMRNTVIVLGAASLVACSNPPPKVGSETQGPVAVEAANDIASVAPRPVEIDRHEYSARLRDGDALWFANEHGDLRLRSSRDGGVHYAAVIQKLDGEQRDVEFGPSRRPGGLQFGIDAPAGWTGRVDASARVPPTSPVEVRTLDGLIEIRAGEINARALTRGGPIKYSGTGTIEARSDTGDVSLSLRAGSVDGRESRVETGGDVELWISSRTDLVVRLVAGSEIVNEVPADIAELVRTADGIATLTFGNGRSELDVEAAGRVVISALQIGP